MRKNRKVITSVIHHKIKKKDSAGTGTATARMRAKNLVALAKIARPSPQAHKKTNVGKALTPSGIVAALLDSGGSNTSARKQMNGKSSREKVKKSLQFNKTDVVPPPQPLPIKKFNFGSNSSARQFNKFPVPSPLPSIHEDEGNDSDSSVNSVSHHEDDPNTSKQDMMASKPLEETDICNGRDDEETDADKDELVHPDVPTVRISSIKKINAILESKKKGSCCYARKLFQILFTKEEILSMTAAGQVGCKPVPEDVRIAVELEATRVYGPLLYFREEGQNRPRKENTASKRKRRKLPSQKIYPPNTVPAGKIARECTINEVFNDMKSNIIGNDKKREKKRRNIAAIVEPTEQATPTAHNANHELQESSPISNMSSVLRPVEPWRMSRNTNLLSTSQQQSSSPNQNSGGSTDVGLKQPEQYAASQYATPYYPAPQHSTPHHKAQYAMQYSRFDSTYSKSSANNSYQGRSYPQDSSYQQSPAYANWVAWQTYYQHQGYGQQHPNGPAGAMYSGQILNERNSAGRDLSAPPASDPSYMHTRSHSTSFVTPPPSDPSRHQSQSYSTNMVTPPRSDPSYHSRSHSTLVVTPPWSDPSYPQSTSLVISPRSDLSYQCI